MKHLILMLAAAFSFAVADARHDVPCKPRILISTDIGGTDADDNQSMAHLLMMNEQFDIEGLVSSPSFGDGSKEELLRMIDLYEKDFPVLKAKVDGLAEPDALKQLCKQGRRGRAPWCGYAGPTEGSRHIVECARRDDSRPLWILVWGALEDVAQALHYAPDIAGKIRIYWIGGPNKKWGCNAYTYMARNFPDLTFIENNASYRGFISDSKQKGKWQGRHQTATDLPLGGRWFTDKADKALFNGQWQGFHSIARWREDVLRDWAMRWEWLKDNPIKTKEKSIKTKEK